MHETDTTTEQLASSSCVGGDAEVGLGVGGTGAGVGGTGVGAGVGFGVPP